MKLGKLLLAGLLLTTAANAQDFVHVNFADGTTEVYVVLNTTKQAVNASSAYRDDELTVLRVGPDRKSPSYTVAKESKLTVRVLLNTNLTTGTVSEEQATISGTLPEGEVVDVSSLYLATHTAELKPSGTVLERVCGMNDSTGADASVSSVCLSKN